MSQIKMRLLAGNLGFLAFLPVQAKTFHETYVRTDQDGNSGSCEQCTEVKTYEAWLEQIAVQPGLPDGASEPIELPAASFALVDAPCGLRPCVM